MNSFRKGNIREHFPSHSRKPVLQTSTPSHITTEKKNSDISIVNIDKKALDELPSPVA